LIFWVYFVLVFLAYVIPFTLLSGVTRISGSFLFWVIFAVFSLILLFKMMGTWNDEY